MRLRVTKYIAYLILIICTSFVWSTEAQAQRAKRHRTRELSSDSIRAQNLKDSIMLADSIDIRREALLKEMSAPVDSAEIAMKSDSLTATKKLPKQRWIPDSKKSLWLALIIPGAGQIYNRKYWKLPLVYGGFVGCTYALTWNSKMYKDYSQAYQDIMSDNPNNNSYLDFLGPGATPELIESRIDYYKELFRTRKDMYRRQRDLSIFAFIGVYILSVIDAYVDAELSDFDITKDLSMKIEPATFNHEKTNRMDGVGLKCSLRF